MHEYFGSNDDHKHCLCQSVKVFSGVKYLTRFQSTVIHFFFFLQLFRLIPVKIFLEWEHSPLPNCFVCCSSLDRLLRDVYMLK